MTEKAEFNAEEWAMLTEAPALAGILVATAEKGGTLRESLAIGKLYAKAREENTEPGLVSDLVASPPQPDMKRYGSPEELRTKGPERLREAASLLDQRATSEEAEAYKKFVLSLAQTAAESHKEGGFIGIGGKRVSDAEAAALAEIAAALDIPYPPPETPAG